MGYLFKSILLLIFPPILLFIFAPHIYEDAIFLINAQSTQGKIISISSVQPPTGRYRYLKSTTTHVVVNFQDMNKREIEFRGKIGNYENNPIINEGQLVTVLYSKHNPKQAKIADLVAYWIEGWGINFLIISACILVPINTALFTVRKYKKS